MCGFHFSFGWTRDGLCLGVLRLLRLGYLIQSIHLLFVVVSVNPAQMCAEYLTIITVSPSLNTLLN